MISITSLGQLLLHDSTGFLKGSHRDMALHPNDLEHKTFSTVRRGLDPAEVKEYLVSVATALRSDARMADTKNQPSTAVARNDAKAILLAAQETAESIRTEARRQADQTRLDAERDAEQTRLAASALVPTQTSPGLDTTDAERRLENKVRQLEALRSEVERLHEESGKAVRAASDERRAAERVRAESIDEISRLRYELDALQTRAGSAGVAASGVRVQVPGPIDGVSSQVSDIDEPMSATTVSANETTPIDTATLSVIDASTPTTRSPLTDAVKSAVGRAIRH